MDFKAKDKTILCVCAHPDDLEFCFGGSVAKWAEDGAKVYYLILTDGSKGSEDPSLSAKKLTKTRQEEQDKAAKTLGVKEVFYLGHIDGELENNSKIRTEVVRFIRRLKPDFVATMDPTVIYDEQYGLINHPDHRIAGQITLDCIYPFSRNNRTSPELLDEGLTPHKVSDIFLFNGQKMNFFVDIKSTLQKKLDSLNCHKSQFKNPDKIERFVKFMAENTGKKSKVQYAEGFVRIHISI